MFSEEARDSREVRSRSRLPCESARMSVYDTEPDREEVVFCPEQSSSSSTSSLLLRRPSHLHNMVVVLGLPLCRPGYVDTQMSAPASILEQINLSPRLPITSDAFHEEHGFSPPAERCLNRYFRQFRTHLMKGVPDEALV